jgi:hypothetical protein
MENGPQQSLANRLRPAFVIRHSDFVIPAKS